MSFKQRLLRRSVLELLRLACVLALLALALITYSALDPTPLPVIFAMSVGHVIGGTAFACYLVSIVLDAMGPLRLNQKVPEHEDP
jgi:hypothetical protein